MNNTLYLSLATGVAFLVTLLLRAFPFLLFSHSKQTPPVILYIGRVISPAVIAVLIVYCLKDTNFTARPYGTAELLAIIVCFCLHKAMRNPLVSIIGSTAIYMLLIQTLG